MSGVTSLSGYGSAIFGQVIADQARVQSSLDALTQQAGDGLVSDSYAGLGAAASSVLSLAPQAASLQASASAIGSVSGATQVTQNAMTQIQSIASNLLATLPNLNGLDPSEIDSAAADARSSLTQMADLLDTQYGGTYVFSGQDSGNPPVPAPDQILTSGFFTSIQTAVGALSANGATATAASTLAIAGSNTAGVSPFSAYMSQSANLIAAPAVSLGGGATMTVGLLASANSNVTSTGSSTTGSYMRDVMRALATIGSLSSAQASDPNVAALVADTQTSLTGAISAMATDVGVLGTQQATLSATQTNMTDLQTVLSGQVGVGEDADMAATLSKLTQTQTQLQTMYQLTATVSSLSLVKYLAAGG
jgi:flagellar hook-associated protein 3 FlgL